MNNLDIKYCNDTLSPDELREYREKLNSEEEKELEKRLWESWERSADLDTSGVDSSEMALMKENIDKTIRGRKVNLYKVSLVAAAVIVPILICAATLLYRQNNRIVNTEVVIATNAGENVTVTLPDNSKVMLNEESSLKYKLSSFSSKERQIDFVGEGYFDVAKNSAIPFVINTRNMRVKVLGTKFNLLVRGNSNSELTLDEGLVMLTALLSGSEIVLNPDQKAILNDKTGLFTIQDLTVANREVWYNGQIAFYRADLPSVIDRLNKCYKTNIVIDSNKYKKDLFTGTVTSRNFNEALDVIVVAYNFKVTYSDGVVYLQDK